MNPETKICQNCKNKFTIEPEDFLFYEKIRVPPPTWCPKCRRQRRLAWRNDFTLYNRACDLCKKRIVASYHPKTKRTVYCNTCWWSDNWEPRAYGRNFDFSRPFFEQFKELQEIVPTLALVNDDGIMSINCQYTQDFAFGKNCYFCFVMWLVENGLYSVYSAQAKDFVDSISIFRNSQFIYDSIWAAGCYKCRNVYRSHSLTNCNFCYDCRDSSDCFLSTGLRHKKYCFKNKQYSKEEYEKIVAEYQLDTWSGQKRAHKEFEEFILKFPRRFVYTRQCTNVIGDLLDNSKNVFWGFNAANAEDCKFVENNDSPKDSYDLTVGGKCNQSYESITPDESYRALFTIYSWKNTEVIYTDSCHSSKYLFGCSGLKKAERCILNKQYSVEEYEKLRGKIIDHMKETDEWGQFFSSRFSPFGYNETVAPLYLPLSKEETIRRGFNWQDELQTTTGKETLTAEKIPDSIHEVHDSITNEILICQSCKRNYRIIPQELSFYQTMSIPIPRDCFQCRNRRRFRLMNPYFLWHRQCTCAGAVSENGIYKNQSFHFHGSSPCPNEFETSYAPDRPEIVYCEACYQSEVV